MSLKLEQRVLHIKPPTIGLLGSRFVNHAVTGNKYRQRIQPHRGAYGAHGVWVTSGQRDIAVSGRAAIGDVQRSGINSLPEGCAGQQQRQINREPFA